jgi:hypothetical protein
MRIGELSVKHYSKRFKKNKIGYLSYFKGQKDTKKVWRISPA